MAGDNINVVINGSVSELSQTNKTVVLKNNKSFIEQITDSNTTYVIRWDFDLSNQEVTIPNNCILLFNGGSLNNGTLIGNNTQINADKVAIFSGIIISGTWNVPNITSIWFGDATNDNVIKQIFNLTNDNVQNAVTIEEGVYPGSNAATKTGVISIGSNTEVNLIGKIKQLPNSYNYGYVIDIQEGAENIYIHGSGIIEGDKLEHTGTTGEHGHGINIQGCYNITVENITIKDCWGDCVYIGYMDTPAINITLQNLILDNGRRQGISITSAKNVIIENCNIKNIKGTAPQAGIDIEPNANSIVDNIVIKNCNITDCKGYGIQLFNKNISSINDVLIQNVIIDGCSKGLGSSKINITGLTIDSVIIRNHISRGLWIIPYENSESEVDLSNIRNVNITNVYVDNQSQASGNNVYVWTHNGFIQGCTFKDAVVLRTYNYTDDEHPQHGLNVFASFILSEGKTVNLHTGCVLSQVSVDCDVLRLPNGHTQFIGCIINCGAISADLEETKASSCNTFEACTVYCTRNILLAYRNIISQSSIYATLIAVSDYCSISESYIYSKLRINGKQVAVKNNRFTIGTSVLSDVYGIDIRSAGTNCVLNNNDITIQDDDETGTILIDGPVCILGYGSIVSNNNIKIKGNRTYSRYAIYVVSTYSAVTVENNSFELDYPLVDNHGYFPNTPNPIPYADSSKNKIGTTENRPLLQYCNRTFQYFDITLNKPIYWNGSSWVDATGATV